jgi:hypothetical protein
MQSATAVVSSRLLSFQRRTSVTEIDKRLKPFHVKTLRVSSLYEGGRGFLEQLVESRRMYPGDLPRDPLYFAARLGGCLQAAVASLTVDFDTSSSSTHTRCEAESRHVRTETPRLALVIAAGICTCGPLASQDRPPDARAAAITVTGCVQRLDESGSLGTTIPDRTPTPEQAGVRANLGEPGSGFMLTDATPPEETSQTDAQNRPRVRYVLIGDEAELEQYEGQRVRARGTLPPPSTKPAESAPIGTSGSTQLQSNTARLKVTSIERVAGSCK